MTLPSPGLLPALTGEGVGEEGGAWKSPCPTASVTWTTSHPVHSLLDALGPALSDSASVCPSTVPKTGLAGSGQRCSTIQKLRKVLGAQNPPDGAPDVTTTPLEVGNRLCQPPWPEGMCLPPSVTRLPGHTHHLPGAEHLPQGEVTNAIQSQIAWDP